jgi:AraC family transcriptional regulator
MLQLAGENRSAGAERRTPLSPRFGALYDGLLEVEKSNLSVMDEYVTENMVAFPGGFVEVRHYSWSRPVESICRTSDSCYLLNLSLAAKGEASTARNLRSNTHSATETLGRMFMVPPEQTMQFNATAGEARSIRCVLSSQLFAPYLDDAPSWRGLESRAHEVLHLRGGEIEWLLRRMYREVREPDFATPQMIETFAKQLAVEIIRKFKLRRAGAIRHVGGLAPWRMRLVDERLHRAGPLPDLGDLANLCDMTVRHLSRAFRAQTGQTIGKHIEAVMVQRANALLGQGVAVGEVAAALGYSTSGSFSAAFRRATGVLPSQVRAPAASRRTASLDEG